MARASERRPTSSRTRTSQRASLGDRWRTATHASGCAALLAAALVGLAPAASAAADDDAILSAQLAEFLAAPVRAVEKLARPVRSELSRVARAAGTSSSVLREIELRRVLLGAEGEPANVVHAAWIPLPEGEAGARALAIVDADNRFLSAKVIGADDLPVAEWEKFAANLQWRPLPRLEGALPPRHLDELRAAPGDDEQARLKIALLDLMKHMNNQASVFNIPEETNPLSRLEQAQLMEREYRAVAELTEPLSPLLGEVAPEFRALALQSADISARVADLLGEGDEMAAGNEMRKLFGGCKSCHGLESQGPTGALSGDSEALRNELGVGDGFYRVGHDLRVSHHDRARSQRVADAFRAGFLLLDAVGDDG